jgi:hypothetical protein
MGGHAERQEELRLRYVELEAQQEEPDPAVLQAPCRLPLQRRLPV